ncbi:MAG: hypothetical protein CVV21_05500 [Candidatus Goldiibacteriota bacterium HGW-Goldbacteria-1]|jgi:ankyrin repeat protein|nr:MAG: hypothetical protein CVV21_05500 [Candidatus Goldiibacteriota bacterium HGW-Goldbacteria-1]
MKKMSFLSREFASAFKDGDFERAHKLVKAGADMHNTIIELDDGHSYRVMEYAVANGLFDHIKALISMGYNINDRDDTGKTAVFIAINNIDHTVLTEVLKYKPDLNLRYKDMGGYYATGRLFHKAENTTVLMQACYISRLRTIKKLLKRGADANAQDSCGFTPLMYLALRYFIPELTCNTSFGLPVYKEAEEILHTEYFEGIEEKDLAPIAQALIKAGADVNIRNKFSKTAKNLAALSSVLYRVLE